MKIAFTGKGGSGKSTLAALFVNHLRVTGQRVLAIDADVNVHLASLLGVATTAETALSHPENVRKVRAHLRGTNERVTVEHFVATTPPGPGSNLVTLEATDPILGAHATRLDDATHVLAVGTYEPKDIGAGCYHGHLAILENLLSHLRSEKEDDWVVCDMVAGTDAFANSLHAQFDVIVVVAEPTPESVSVARRYAELAEAAGVADVLAVVGNKVADDADLEYLTRELGREPLTAVRNDAGLRRARQSGEPPRLIDSGPLDQIVKHARGREMSGDRRDALMRTLHLRLARKGWVRSAHGDVTSQLAEVGAEV
ncbi:ATP-binding protein [Actinoplanes sp. OR16]|uniref:ATP-binding protein n=1 Tax=Actinoplanes sp. OR16 TaxID=946334 RepID=UPI000F6BCA97|nr:ATP-binding protein [Actinoplanes sp. OR16]BBH67610.1 ATP-binding protein [Actinoplanes sp. OR16]